MAKCLKPLLVGVCTFVFGLAVHADAPSSTNCQLTRTLSMDGVLVADINCGFGETCKDSESCCQLGGKFECCKSDELCNAGVCHKRPRR